MKKINLLVLSTIITIQACSHTKVVESKIKTDDFPISITDSKWMDETDYVKYVNFINRIPSNTGSKYNIIGDCDGYPMVDVKTAPGFCLGLVYEGSGLKKPRTAASLTNSSIVITDQGSWEPYNGKIYLLNFENNNSSLKEIFSNKTFPVKDPRREISNRPHQISQHTDGLYYVGTANSILRFNPLVENPSETLEVVVQNLPAEGLHPLKSFVFDDEGSLYINIGSATNVCHKNGLGGLFGNRKKVCEEAEDANIGQGQIRRYLKTADGKFSKSFSIAAKGLRNSVAMVWDEKNKLLIQGENSRDAIDKDSKINRDFPHDEVNLINPKATNHFGWPYCYDNNVNSPEWKQVNCVNYTKPKMFLPAHSAPLGFTIYKGSMFPEWYHGRLLATLHGFEAKGHRLVALKRDQNGLPTGTPQSVIYGWENKGEQKFGSPVGLTEMPDGSMLIIEDTNQKVLRLFYDPTLGDGRAVEEIETAETEINPNRETEEETRRLKLLKKIQAGNAPAFTMFQARVIDQSCVLCHGGENAPGIQLLKYDDVGNEAKILKAKKEQVLYSMVKGETGFPPMPPQGFNSDAEKAEAIKWLKLWIEQIPQI